jgi:hypothetical protein
LTVTLGLASDIGPAPLVTAPRTVGRNPACIVRAGRAPSAAQVHPGRSHHSTQEAEMKKLALELDDLKIDTFVTGKQPTVRGTVEGHYGTNHTAMETCTQTALYTHCNGVQCY